MRPTNGAVNTLAVAMTATALLSIGVRVYNAELKRPPSRFSVRADWKEVGSDGATIGRRSAPVTLVVFSDFQCPYCKTFSETFRSVMDSTAGNVRLVFRHRPIEELHSAATSAAKAAICADSFARFREMHDALFAQQDSIGTKSWLSFAVAANISDTVAFGKCMSNASTLARLALDRSVADRLNVKGTPVVLVNDVMIQGNPSRAVLDSLVREALRLTQSPKGSR